MCIPFYTTHIQKQRLGFIIVRCGFLFIQPIYRNKDWDLSLLDVDSFLYNPDTGTRIGICHCYMWIPFYTTLIQKQGLGFAIVMDSCQYNLQIQGWWWNLPFFPRLCFSNSKNMHKWYLFCFICAWNILCIFWWAFGLKITHFFIWNCIRRS